MNELERGGVWTWVIILVAIAVIGTIILNLGDNGTANIEPDPSVDTVTN